MVPHQRLQPQRAGAQGQFENPANGARVSAASLWEAAIKFALGKLKLPAPYADIFPRQLELNGFSLLPIAPAHCATRLTLPFHHRARSTVSSLPRPRPRA